MNRNGGGGRVIGSHSKGRTPLSTAAVFQLQQWKTKGSPVGAGLAAVHAGPQHQRVTVLRLRQRLGRRRVYAKPEGWNGGGKTHEMADEISQFWYFEW